jgi:hypothetical protein
MKPKAFLLFLLIVILIAVFSVTNVFADSRGGATQISGIGYFDDSGSCADDEGLGSDFALNLTGDLDGCVYVFVENSVCSPSGTYRETGTEIYVVEGADGEDGTFSTVYRFTGKYEDCPSLVGEIFGRCQHPIVAGSGTGDYAGVTGRLDFKDDIVEGNFPYRGHLR